VTGHTFVAIMDSAPQHPFQCIRYLNGNILHGNSYLIASAGPRLYSLSPKDGHIRAVWPSESQIPDNTNSKSTSESDDYHEPPEKKRRLSSSAGPPYSPQECRTEKTAKQPPSTTDGPASINWTTIPLVLVSEASRHVIAVTAEDKSLRVFEVKQDGTLTQKSKRYVAWILTTAARWLMK
jgi:tRNA (guanine-N(7)-)-methyltransferase subunit TRM82